MGRCRICIVDLRCMTIFSSQSYKMVLLPQTRVSTLGRCYYNCSLLYIEPLLYKYKAII